MLAKEILTQASIDLGLSIERDVQTLSHRVEHEGIEFLTITLPVLCDALERGLEDGTFKCPAGFARHRSLPSFLKGFFKRVFDLDGRLLDEPDVECIFYIRQITRFQKKLKLPCSERREAAAVRRFKEVEGELHDATRMVEREDILLDQISRMLWGRVFPEPKHDELYCKHGPGATADRVSLNERNRIRQWHIRAELSFPSDLHCYPNYGYAAEAHFGGDLPKEVSLVEGPDYLDVKDEPGVRVVMVPKTQTTPRVIAIEPSHVQYMQQGLMRYVVPILESNPLTRHSIRFSDQTTNQRLAYLASRDRRLATLDMKEASDRVHLHLVQRIFQNSGILEYLEDSRSLHANLPDGSNIILNKFASMGSAMCFPVEAMVFYTLILTALHRADGINPSFRSIERYSRDIDIFGDDIVVPTDSVDCVIQYLESFSLLVNRHKSFWKGNFRESCGGDYYCGTDVKPVYARQLMPDDGERWTPGQVMAWVSTADQFYRKGMWHIAQVIRDLVSRAVRCRVPRATREGPGVFYFSFIFNTGLVWDSKLQCLKQKRLDYIPLTKKDNINDDTLACLNRWGHSHAGHSGNDDFSPSWDVRLRDRSNSGLDQSFAGLCPDKEESDFRVRSQVSGAVSQPSQDADPLASFEAVTSCLPCDTEGTVRIVHGATLTDLLHGKSRFTERSVLPRVSNRASVDGDVRGFTPPEVGTYSSFLLPVWCVAERDDSGPPVSTRENNVFEMLTTANRIIDFESSTKRGGFKPKHRWVPLSGVRG